MTTPTQSAAERLRELDDLIADGRKVDPAQYLHARTAAELEVREQEVAERIAAEQDALDAKLLRRKRIGECLDGLPTALAQVERKVAAAVHALAQEDDPDRLLFPHALRGQTIDLSTLVGRLITALEAGAAPAGTRPANDVMIAAHWMIEDTAAPWKNRLDLSDEVRAIEYFVRPLISEF